MVNVYFDCFRSADDPNGDHSVWLSSLTFDPGIAFEILAQLVKYEDLNYIQGYWHLNDEQMDLLGKVYRRFNSKDGISNWEGHEYEKE